MKRQALGKTYDKGLVFIIDKFYKRVKYWKIEHFTKVDMQMANKHQH